LVITFQVLIFQIKIIILKLYTFRFQFELLKMSQVINLEGNIQTDSDNMNKNINDNQQTKSPFGSGMFSSVSMSSIQSIDLNSLKPKEWVLKRRETLRPWAEFFNFSKFKKPANIGQATGRLFKNISHYQTNYLFVFIFLAIYCM
jgi:hypothetical protein